MPTAKFPMGVPPEKVMFNASLKIYVEGYRAFSKGRFEGPVGYYDIDPIKAPAYWAGKNRPW